MRRPLAAHFIITVLLVATAQAATQLESIGRTSDDLPLAWAPWHGKTIAITDGGVRLVDWLFDPGDRAIDLLATSFHEVRLVAFGDSLHIDQPGDLDGYLVTEDAYGAIRVRSRGPDWHLASNRIAGAAWFVDLGDEDITVYPAPGELPAASTVGMATSVLPHDQAVSDGDRAAVARRFGGQTLIQVFDLSDPLAPSGGDLVTHDEPAWIALRGHTLVVAGSLLRTYDVSDPDDPELLFELGPAGEYSQPSFRDDGILAVWRNGDIRLVDASDPADLRPGATLPAVLPLGEEPWPLLLEDDRLVTRGQHGLHGYELAAGHYVLLDAGVGWWRPEGSLLAIDGRYAYLQGDRRYVLDLHGPAGRIEVLGAVPSPPPGSGAFLSVTDGHLIYADGSGDVVIEDVSEPLLPAETAVIDLPSQVREVSFDAPFLSLVRTGIVDLFDLSNPAFPQNAGFIDAVQHPTQSVVHGHLLFILDHVNGTDDSIHISDLSIPGPPPIVAVHDLAGDAWLHRVIQMTCRGSDLLAQVVRTQGGDVETYTLRLDVSDPADPVVEVFDQLHYFWGDWSQPPVELVGLHVTVEVNNLYLNDYQGDPVTMPILDILQLPSRIRAMTTEGNQLLTHYDRSLVRCTVSSSPPVAAPVTVPIAPTVQAVPNPFNPRTTFAFEMSRAGEARAEVHDLRGRRVRTLVAELPAGPARLTWNGAADDGGALPSGTYLVRVVTPETVLTTRCALIR